MTLRIAMYSHDTMGLGHVRRNLLVAQALCSSPLRPEILMISGVREAGVFTLPPGVERLTLPKIHKDLYGRYHSGPMAISIDGLVELRAKKLHATLAAFAPDVLIVDNVPRGALGELDQALEYLRDGGRTRCVLGLRDVLDDPAVVQREWKQAKNEDTIRTYYDAVWIYGDPSVFDPVREYRFAPEVAARVRYAGYLDQGPRLNFPGAYAAEIRRAIDLPPGRLVLCLVGGGQDGVQLSEAFVGAALPEGMVGVLLLGPFMPPEARRRIHEEAAPKPRLRVVDFSSEPTLLVSRADRVIAMGGYNTVCEVLSFRRSALIVPRVKPRSEQLIRALRLRDLGFLDVLHPDDLSAHALSEWLRHEPGPSCRGARIDLKAAARLPGLLGEVLGIEPCPAGLRWSGRGAA